MRWQSEQVQTAGVIIELQSFDEQSNALPRVLITIADGVRNARVEDEQYGQLAMDDLKTVNGEPLFASLIRPKLALLLSSTALELRVKVDCSIFQIFSCSDEEVVISVSVDVDDVCKFNSACGHAGSDIVATCTPIPNRLPSCACKEGFYKKTPENPLEPCVFLPGTVPLETATRESVPHRSNETSESTGMADSMTRTDSAPVTVPGEGAATRHSLAAIPFVVAAMTIASLSRV